MGKLSANQAAFVLEYERNGRNAGAAYRKIHPQASPATSWSNGHKLLRNAEVQAAITKLRAERASRLKMDAEEAMLLTSIRARADIRLLYDDKGDLLPKTEWPDEIAKAVREVTADGTIKLYDGQAATRDVLTIHGKLKTTVDVNHFDHVGYLARANVRHKEALDARRKARAEASSEEAGTAGRNRKASR